MHKNSGRKQTPEHIAKRFKNYKSWKKRKYTEQHRNDLRKKLLGNKINLGRKQSEEERRKRSKKLKGEKCHLWKSGINKINDTIRKSVEYKLWREAVFKRDNYTCVWCGQVGGTLHADHIKPFAYFPELRFSIDNGRTLCISCHKTTDTYGEKCKQFIKSNITVA